MNHPTDLGDSMHRAEAQRRLQVEEGQRRMATESTTRRTITLAQGTAVNPSISRPAQQGQSTEKKRPGKPVTGHEAFLRALCHSGANVIIEKVSSGQQYQGHLKHSDAYTVTMLVKSIKAPNSDSFEKVTPVERVIYKHDISEFYTTTPRAEAVA